MSTNPAQKNKFSVAATRKKRNITSIIIIALVLIVGAVIAALIFNRSSDKNTNGDKPVFIVKKGPLTISVTESGTIKNREKVIVKSQVEGRCRIIWLIEEGKHVKKGDRLMDLDSSQLEEKQVQQEINVTTANVNFIRAEVTLAVTKSQADSDIEKAELNSRFAKLDLQKYIEGEYPQQIQEAKAKITIAQEQLQRAADRVAWSKKLHEEDYLTRTELQADELAAKTSQLDLELAKSRLDLLKKFTHKRKLAELESDVQQAKMALERAKQKAAADVLQAEADLKAKESKRNRQRTHLKKIKTQIEYCKIKAPVDGQVVYATTGGRRHWRSAQEELAEGQDVYQRQELFHLPTAKAMMTEIKIHESAMSKVSVGMEARITVGEKVFMGHLKKIAPMPESQDWLNPGLKVFNTEIYLDEENGYLRPGLSCQVEVIVAEYDSAFYVPMQCVHVVDGKATVFVRSGDDFKPQAVKVGLDNGRMVHVIEGLSQDQVVLMNPPLDKAAAPQSVGRQKDRQQVKGRQQATGTAKAKGKRKATGNRQQGTGTAKGRQQKKPGRKGTSNHKPMNRSKP